MKTLKIFFFNALTLFLSCALFWGGTEWGLRTFYRNKLKTYYDSQTEMVLGKPPARKEAGEYRIFIFGESAAYGFPVADRYSVAAWMRKALNRLLPSKKIRVINCGWPGKSSHQIRLGVETILQYQPDLLVMYVGNNEAGIDSRLFTDNALYRLDLAFFYRSFIYRLLKLRIEKARKYLLTRAGRPPAKAYRESEIAGILYKNPAVTREDYARILASYRRNMEGVIRSAKSRSVEILFITLPSNVRTFPPGYSLHHQELTAAALSEWEGFYKEGDRAEKEGRADAAVTAFEKAAEIDPTHSELQFKMAKLYDVKGDYEKARLAYLAAKDNDGFPGRGTQEINDTIRQIAADQGLLFVDIEKIFEERSPQRIVSSDLMYDDVHPTVHGQQIISDEILKGIQAKELMAPAALWDWASYEQERLTGVEWKVENSVQAYHEVLNGLLLWEQKRYPEAVSNLEKAIVSMPGFVESFAFLADAYYHLGQPEKAAGKLQHIADKDPELLDFLRKKYPELEESCAKFFSAPAAVPA